ncbi:MAG: hypothetical protein HY006_02440 [Candidatus Sungbacteria bacterium]|nr:hypothetical protein [Candidatus Sungbacteria bacterium]
MEDTLRRLRKKFISFRCSRQSLLFLFFVLLIGAQSAFLISRGLFLRLSSVDTLEIHAKKILDTCVGTGYRPGCYDKEIPKLMDVLSMEDAFGVTRIIQDKDTSYQYCHVLGHNLSAREIKKDPAKWKDVLTRCPSGVCSNGCLHGGLQERFRADSFADAQVEQIKPDLQTLCEARGQWYPTGLEQASCYHAIGHLTMYITNADIRESVALCKEIAGKKDGRDFTHLCFDGAFMQIFQPLEPEDFALVKGKQPTKQTVGAFCNVFSGAERGACRSESWPLFVEELQTPQGTVTLCSSLEDDPAEEDRCYSTLFYVMTPRLHFNVADISTFCQKFSEAKRVQQCFANAASRMIETDYRNIAKAARLCTMAAPFRSDDACFKELLMYATYNFHPTSPESLQLCQALPEPWNTQCLEQRTIRQQAAVR